MNTLTLRIYLSIVAVLLLFAFGAGWLFQREMAQERHRVQSVMDERMEAWGDLLQRSLPANDAPPQAQAQALEEWSRRLRIPLALDAPGGGRIAASESFVQGREDGRRYPVGVPLDDGRTLWVLRRGPPPREGADRPRRGPPPAMWSVMPRGLQSGAGLAAVLVLLFVAVAAGAWPVARGLTRRLKALQQGVEAFGAGRLEHRVAVSGRDEVAAVAESFNRAAARIEALVRSHQSLLANASHELRSPLARMKMAVSMLDDTPPAQRERLRREIDTNIAELDALVEEVLLASRLDAQQPLAPPERVDLLGLAAEEAARVNAAVDGMPRAVMGDERLLRRALRNLLENARRYGGGEVSVTVDGEGGEARVRVCDRGPGVPQAQRERIFEPFYRLPGHAETAGGVGLGLSLVRQIAERHGGRVRCLPREGGGSCFELCLPRVE
jgi:signal transduction histidine kinase